VHQSGSRSEKWQVTGVSGTLAGASRLAIAGGDHHQANRVRRGMGKNRLENGPATVAPSDRKAPPILSYLIVIEASGWPRSLRHRIHVSH
jgi:hypothetical protein